MCKSADDQVPSVESEYPEERIAACNENKRRKESLDDSGEEDIKEETRKSQLQVEQSERRANVQVAADAKESQRRIDLKEARRLRVEKLEKEARSSMDKFEEITRSYSQAKIKVIPQELQEALSSQQQQCDLYLEDKNKVINEVKQELKARDDRYVKQLMRQAEEVDLMIDRMEEQIKGCMMTYRDELDQTQNAYEHERKILLTGNRNEWEQHMKDRRDKELENMIQRRRKVEEYKTTLQQLRVDVAEEYNTIEGKLGSNVQVKQQQLQQTKATNQLRQETLESDCKVLKKRDKDYAILRSQQKRKIIRQQDVVNDLKDQCVKQRKQALEELHGLVDECTHNMQHCRNMKKKMRHFTILEDKRFVDMWQMNEEEVRQLVERALDIDQVLHLQQLGLAWERPHIPHMAPPSGQIQSANPPSESGAESDGEDTRFWESLANVLPEAKFETWNALESALEKYYALLTKRSRLVLETQGLKQQNGELRALLHQSLNAKVNAELGIHPPR